MIINLNAPLNNLSFGNVSFGILYALFKKGVKVHFFPNQFDLSAFDKIPEDFKNWLTESAQSALKDYDRNNPSLKLWHIQSSEQSIGDCNLFTFHETDTVTDIEKNILKNQKNVFVSNEFTKEVFERAGLTNVHYIPLGFDSLHFKKIEKRLVPDDVISFGLFGKFEVTRKNTQEILQLWVKKYGNNPKYMLQVAVTNPFFDKQRNHAVIQQALQGKSYHNLNFLPYVQKLSEYNQILNSVDIVLALSRSEGWGLPEFSATALGKHAITHDRAGYKSWANSDNSVLIESTGKIPVFDGVFFNPGPFNQGNFFSYDLDSIEKGLDEVEKRYLANPVNEAGLKLQTEFTWDKTVEKILEKII